MNSSCSLCCYAICSCVQAEARVLTTIRIIPQQSRCPRHCLLPLAPADIVRSAATPHPLNLGVLPDRMSSKQSLCHCHHRPPMLFNKFGITKESSLLQPLVSSKGSQRHPTELCHMPGARPRLRTNTLCPVKLPGHLQHHVMCCLDPQSHTTWLSHLYIHQTLQHRANISMA